MNVTILRYKMKSRDRMENSSIILYNNYINHKEVDDYELLWWLGQYVL